MTFECVPENLPQRSCVWPQCGLDSFGQRARRQAVELFQHPRTGPIEFGVLVENDVDAGETKHRVAADRLHFGDAEQRHRQWVSDLVFDVFWTAPHPLRENDLLVFADVRNCINGNRIAWKVTHLPIKRSNHDTPSHDRQNKQRYDQLVVNAEPNDATEKRSTVRVYIWSNRIERIGFSLGGEGVIRGL